MKKSIIYIAVIFIVAIIMYLPSLSNHFVWDDNMVVKSNPALSSSSPLWLFGQSFLPPIYTTEMPSYYRPMVVFWFWLQARIFGRTAIWFRLFNLAMFLASALILYKIAYKLLYSQNQALLCTALFALNPIHTENVAFISGLTDISAGFFILLAFLAYISRKWWGKYIIAPFMFLFALLSKEIAVPMFVLFPLYDFLIKKKKPLNSLLSIAQFIPPLVLYFMLRYYVLGVWGGYASYKDGILSHLTYVPYSICRYMQNILFPIGLSPLYAKEQGSYSTMFWLFWILPLGLMAVFLIWKMRKRLLWFFIIWAVLFILPVLRIFSAHSGALWADRFAYIPTIGTSIILGYYLDKLANWKPRHWHRIGAIIIAAYFAIFFIVGFEYSFWWRNDFMNSRRLIMDAPSSPMGYLGMAEDFRDIGEIDSAYAYIQMAIELDSTASYTLATASEIAFQKRDYEKAIEYSEKLIRMKPSFSKPYVTLSRVYLVMEDTVKALDYSQKAVAICPFSPFTHYGHGEIMIAVGDTASGIESLQNAIQLLPDNEILRRRYEYIIACMNK